MPPAHRNRRQMASVPDCWVSEPVQPAPDAAREEDMRLRPKPRLCANAQISHRETMATARSRCLSCAVRATALCSAVSADAAADLGRAFHRRRVQAGQVISSGDRRAKMVAIIVSGVVKLTNVRPDGRQQIVGLLFASDFLGRPYVGASNLLAEAASDLELCCFSGEVFEGLMQRHPDLERALLKRTLDGLDTAREWMFLLGRKTAQERVASLIHLMAVRMPQAGGRCLASEARRFASPLSRTEMADCLGLRLETVSRQIALLRAAGILATSRTRFIEVREMSELLQRSEHAAE